MAERLTSTGVGGYVVGGVWRACSRSVVASDLREWYLTNKWVLLFIIVSLLAIEVGRRLQVMVDLWRKWRGTLAALPGMERDAKRGVWTFIKWGALGLLILWIATHKIYV